MKTSTIMHRAGGAVRRVSFRLQKRSPEILVTLGVIGTVASAVVACRATTKLSDILNRAKSDLDSIHECTDNADLAEALSPEERKREIAVVYAQTSLRLAQLYAPAVLLGSLSITSILASNHMLHKRNMALAAAYATIDRGFKEYRSRVAERFGEEVDRELKYRLQPRTITEVVTDEDGKEKKVKRVVKVAALSKSDYARLFTSDNECWANDEAYNLLFLRSQQQYANDLLKRNGHLFLNEVYDMLAIPRTKAGQVVGWVYDEKNPLGDNYVDFGIFSTYEENESACEQVFLLDFNVDGNIWDAMCDQEAASLS